MSRFGECSASLKAVLTLIERADVQRLAAVLEASPLGSPDLVYAMIFAIEEDRSECVEVIVLIGGQDLEDLGGGISPLGFALFTPAPNTAKVLCRLGADVNAVAQSDTGNRPLHLAIEMESMHSWLGPNGYDATVTTLLLTLGADPLIVNNNGATALDIARYGRHFNAYSQILEKLGNSGLVAAVASRPILGANAELPNEIIGRTWAIELLDGDGQATGFMLSVAQEGRVSIRGSRSASASDQLWELRPSVSPEHRSDCVHLVNMGSGAELVQPNPTGSLVIGPPPLLRVDLTHCEGQARSHSWRLAKAHHKNSLSIFDPTMAYCVAEDIPAVLGSWIGGKGQFWQLRSAQF